MHQPAQGLQLPERPWSWQEILVSTHNLNEIMSKNLAEMTPEELSAIIDRWEGEKAAIAKDITPA